MKSSHRKDVCCLTVNRSRRGCRMLCISIRFSSSWCLYDSCYVSFTLAVTVILLVAIIWYESIERALGYNPDCYCQIWGKNWQKQSHLWSNRPARCRHVYAVDTFHLYIRLRLYVLCVVITVILLESTLQTRFSNLGLFLPDIRKKVAKIVAPLDKQTNSLQQSFLPTWDVD